MSYHIEKYFTQHPEEFNLNDAGKENKELLLKAEQFGYIILKRPFANVITYTQEQLNQAEMWKEKGVLDE